MAQSNALQAHIRGLREAKAAFLALPSITREAMLSATETTASELARNAKANILKSPSVQTRSLYNSIAFKVTPTNGRAKVGVTSGTTRGLFSAGTGVAGELKKRTIKGYVVGKRLIMPSRYAHFVEFGTKKMRAEPFMIPAAEGQKTPFLDRCKAAGRQIEREATNVGGRNL